MIYSDSKNYAKVWSATKNEKYIDLSISTSTKDSDNNRTYSSWLARAIGHAKNSLKDVKEGDNIIINKCSVQVNKVEKEGEKPLFLTQVLIYDATISNNTQSEEPTKETAQQDDFEAAANSDEEEPW